MGSNFDPKMSLNLNLFWRISLIFDKFVLSEAVDSCSQNVQNHCFCLFSEAVSGDFAHDFPWSHNVWGKGKTLFPEAGNSCSQNVILERISDSQKQKLKPKRRNFWILLGNKRRTRLLTPKNSFSKIKVVFPESVWLREKTEKIGFGRAGSGQLELLPEADSASRHAFASRRKCEERNISVSPTP